MKYRIKFNFYKRINRDRMTWILPELSIYKWYAENTFVSWIISMGWIWLFLDVAIIDKDAEEKISNISDQFRKEK